MLDNVSTQDFGNSDDIQQQVQDALTQHEMKKMEIVEPSGGFMASPVPSVTAATSSTSSTATSSTPVAEPPASAPPVATQEPFNVASLEVVAPPPIVMNEDGSAVPRPLTPEEDKQAVIEAENAAPTVSAPAISSLSSPAQDGASATVNDSTSTTSDLASTSDTTATSDASSASPSAPVDPPAAPPELPAVTLLSTSSDDSSDADAVSENENESASVESPSADSPASEEATTSEPEEEPAPTVVAPAESVPAVEPVKDETPTSEPEETPSASESSNDTATPLSSAGASAGIPAVDTNKLASLKQHALDHLEPLADQLDQSPEEEFRTTMMRIQANDNHTLLEKALNAAKKIEDGSARAKALLDIINEINYFAQVADDQN